MRWCRPLLFAIVVCVCGAGRVEASPISVTLVGSFQSEIGCSGDWDPACGASGLTYDASDDVWQGTFTIPGGNWEYKVAIDGSWAENYGANATPNGSNIPLSLAGSTEVKFYYSDETHWITSNASLIVVAPGSFQSELGCAGDWDPSCLQSWLQDPDGDGIYTFDAVLPAGNFETKAALYEGWIVNYGAGGTPNGANIDFTVPLGSTGTRFSFNSATNVLSVQDLTPTQVPEPATLLLMASGLAGVWMRRRRV